MKLSPSELAVVRLYAIGQKKQTIAHTLGVSEHNIGKRIEKIYLKLGVHDRSTLTHWAIRFGVVPLMEFKA